MKYATRVVKKIFRLNKSHVDYDDSACDNILLVHYTYQSKSFENNILEDLQYVFPYRINCCL